MTLAPAGLEAISAVDRSAAVGRPRLTSRPIGIALACCLILAPLWIVTMFGRGLWTPDEPREADISWRMSMQAERAIPLMAGEPFLEKPPGAYWAAAAAASLFPGRDAALRAPNLLYAVVVLGAVVLLAFMAGGPGAAWVAGLSSASFVLSLQVASWLATDAAMMSGVALAMLGIYGGMHAAEGRAKLLWYLLMHSGLTWAFMAKGPAGWLVPGLAAAGLIAFERNWRELWRWELWIGAAIPVGVIGAWLLAVARSSDGAHALSVLLWSNVAGRVVTLHSQDAQAYATGHRNWPGKYLLELPCYLLPWTFLFVAALRRAAGAARAPEGRPWRFALCALVLPLIALSLAGTARGIYAAPVLPAAALLIGLWAREAIVQPDRFNRRMLRMTLWLVTALALILFAAAGLIASADPAAARTWPFAAGGAVAAAIALGCAFRRLRRDAWRGMMTATFAAFVLAFLGTAAAVLPALDGWHDIASLVRQINRDTGSRSLALYAADETLVSVVDRTLVPLGRAVLRPADIASARALLATRDPPVFVILLRGVGEGPVLQRLRALGVKTRAPPPSPLVADLTSQLGLMVEKIYELPQGRRYALLSKPSPQPELPRIPGS